MVTGAAGYIGRRLVQSLAKESRTVVALYHHRLPESLDHSYPVCSDMSSPELMAAPLRGVETVVHLAWDGGIAGPLAGLGRWTAHDAPRATRNSQMLGNLITAMERAGTRRIVFVSALGASATAESAFLRDKYLGEFLVLNSAIPEKVIIRSAVVWGGQSHDDQFLRSILRVTRYPVYPVPKLADKLAPVHIDDLCQTLLKACEAKLARPAALTEMDGGETYAVDEIFKMVAENLTKKSKLALGGFIGKTLLPLFERDANRRGANASTTATANAPKIGHFLALGRSGEERETLAGLTAKPGLSFRERLTTPPAAAPAPQSKA
jgi:NADH dehydrogenase